MEPYTILQEHTLVLAGESVDIGSVWQGWPSKASIRLEEYRAALRRHLEIILHQQVRDEESDDGNMFTVVHSSHPLLGINGELQIQAAHQASLSPLTLSPNIGAGRVRSGSGGVVRSPLLSTGATKPSYASIEPV